MRLFLDFPSPLTSTKKKCIALSAYEKEAGGEEEEKLEVRAHSSAAPEATQPDVPRAAGGAHRSLVLRAINFSRLNPSKKTLLSSAALQRLRSPRAYGR